MAAGFGSGEPPRHEIHIRRASPADAELLADTGRATFQAAYGRYNTSEDMRDYLARHFSLQAVRAELADPAVTFLIGYQGDEVIGYALLRAGRIPAPVSGLNPIELARFYVLEALIGRGFGSGLMRGCLDEAAGLGYQTMWLGVWEENARAIRFYQKWGFDKVGNQTFVLGRDVQNDFVMARTITS